MQMTFNEQGDVALAEGELEVAEQVFAESLRLNPKDSKAIDGLGRVCLQRRAYALAVELFQKAVELNPHQEASQLNLARSLNELGRFDETIASLERLPPDARGNPEYLLIRGNALRALGRYEESLEAYSFGLKVSKAHRVAFLVNKANVLIDQKIFNQAEAILSEALSLEPENKNIVFNISLLRLRLGDWSEGWSLHENRPQMLSKAVFVAKSASSKNIPSEGNGIKKTLLTFEQGLGDTIQFIRFAGHQSFKNAELTLHVPSSLRRLVAYSFPYCRVTDQKEVLTEHFDHTSSLLSVPASLNFNAETDVHFPPYLRVDPGVSEGVRNSLRIERQRLNIGIQWRGSDNPRLQNRSIPLGIFEQVIPEGAVVFSLRKEVTPSEKSWLKSRDIVDLSSVMGDFYETASIVENLDIVLTCDTSVAHLAGALGKRVFVLLPYSSGWVWMENRSDSPWYPSMTLVRQRSPGDWQSCVSTIRQQRIV